MKNLILIAFILLFTNCSKKTGDMQVIEKAWGSETSGGINNDNTSDYIDVVYLDKSNGQITFKRLFYQGPKKGKTICVKEIIH